MINGYEVVIGKILSPHGIGGMVKVYPYSDFPERVQLLAEVAVEQESQHRVYAVEKASVHGSYWLIKFRGVNSRDEAEVLRGSLVRIPRQERLSLPEGTYYHDQLEGLEVYKSDGSFIGVVAEVVSGRGHDQLMIDRSDVKDKRNLIPAVKDFIRQIDLSEGTIVVELPEGMLDL